ncbi:carboxypeptidase regulatory-like domain-containing protein [Desulfurispira natronophila]|uniref:Nickel transport protein n=1 Tax=Desulfurispira natronophila TaxID=682562 RepID=A0A7W8DHP8_9BACT|nr:carboxypeptidase regulatory-like domain-containing protein [Desulfurispira natronophila]MBB5022518.1 nickel transport protein [Desulfurispira natronophila]
MFHYPLLYPTRFVFTAHPTVKALWQQTIAGLCFVLLSAGASYGHGVVVHTEVQQAIQVEGVYDDGTPMAEAQVLVFSPGNPRTPWKTTTTDEQGKVSIVTDPEVLGRWSIQLRQAGHGATVYLDMEGDTVEVISRTESGWLKTTLIFALVLWSALATAGYFKRGRARHAHS